MEALQLFLDKFGTPLTAFFWVYIVIMVLIVLAALGTFGLVLYTFWKDRKKFKGF